MCGISGWINFKEDISDKEDILNNMIATLKNRGPDTEGKYISRHVLFGHRRLIVVDPKGGSQPMQKTVDGNKFIICYNGELYNTEDIRNELIEKGYSFNSYSDTEVLLTSYICWGEECVDKLNGIFAFAIYDEKNQKVMLVRDPLGVKPIFYAQRNNSLIFGSELKTLLAHPEVKPIVDKKSISEMFALGPASPLGSGTYKDVFEIAPGNLIVFSKDEVKIREYWSVEVEDFNENLEQATEHVKELLHDTIKRQLVSDVPLCCFLSGGLDSSAISSVASIEYRKKGEVLTTYSIDYEGNDKYFKASLFQPTSDQYWAEFTSKAIKTNHRTTLLSQVDLINALSDAVHAKDLPGMADVDSSLYLFCKDIRKDFVVGISGECADEIFGGYPWFTNENMMNADTFPWSLYAGKRQEILGPALDNLHIPEIAHYYYQDTLDKVPHQENEDPFEFRMRELFYLNIKWFMVNLLTRKDRMSMANSLEVRVPFADKRLVQYAFNIPSKIKFADGREKGLLRRAVSDILPEEIVYRKKSPYPKTQNPEYTDLVCSRMNKILSDKNSPLLELINKDVVQKIVDTKGESYKAPWFGQLMTGPQMLAYLIQMDIWLKDYNVQLEI